MTDVRSAWKDAGDRLSTLGSTLKSHYDEQRGADGEPTAAGAQAKEQVGAAVKRLTEAVQDAFEAVGVAAKDPAVKDDAKKVGQSLAGALSATFAEVSDDLRRVAEKAKGATTDAPASTSTPTSTDTPAGASEPAKPVAPVTDSGEEPPTVEPWGTP